MTKERLHELEILGEVIARLYHEWGLAEAEAQIARAAVREMISLPYQSIIDGIRPEMPFTRDRKERQLGALIIDRALAEASVASIRDSHEIQLIELLTPKDKPAPLLRITNLASRAIMAENPNLEDQYSKPVPINESVTGHITKVGRYSSQFSTIDGAKYLVHPTAFHSGELQVNIEVLTSEEL